MDAPMAISKNSVLVESLCYLSVDMVAFHTVFYFPRFYILCLICCSNLPRGNLYALISSCNFDLNYLSFITVLIFCVAELLLAIRVSSLYGNRKFVIWSLRGLVAGAVVGGAVAVALHVRQWYAYLYYEFLPGCWIHSKYSNPMKGWPMWAAFLCVEGVLMLLTAYKLFSYRNRMNQTVAMLARDSIVYFIVIFACFILDILSNVDHNITMSVSIPTQSVASIAVGRMMMNIRGLIMDDSGHTTHLRTLQFAIRTNAGSEVEERTGCGA